MAHLHRFYQPGGVPEGEDAVLTREESHHATRVLRIRCGAPVELFDGQGNGWSGVVSEVGRNEVRVRVTGSRFTPRAAPPVTLVQAWLHRDKVLDDLVREATVLGVDRIVFFRAEHSEKKPRLHEKWERLAIEACKQCGRVWTPAFVIAESLAEALDALPDAALAIAAMEGPHQPLSALSRTRDLAYIVGPEGDFSAEELALARTRGACGISLGAYTLRSEMAALTGLTLIQHYLGRLGPLAG